MLDITTMLIVCGVGAIIVIMAICGLFLWPGHKPVTHVIHVEDVALKLPVDAQKLDRLAMLVYIAILLAVFALLGVLFGVWRWGID